MKVLGIDTATLAAGIALVDGDRVIADLRHDVARRSNDVLVAIDRACREAGWRPTEIEAVAVGAGPGSFTGLRIGMATAKGIAFAAGRPLWAVSSLAALASLGRGDVRVAALDARKGEVFAGVYTGAGMLIGTEACVHPSELVAWVTRTLEAARPEDGAAGLRDGIGGVRDDGSVHYIGDAAAAYPEQLATLGMQHATPTGLAVIRCALASTREDLLVDGKPSYIRPAEAEVMYPDGVPGALRKR